MKVGQAFDMSTGVAFEVDMVMVMILLAAGTGA
jgi:hypothetical protein